MLNPVIEKHLQLSDNFEVAFPDKRIPNGFIDKGKTRLGITYTCFHDERHTIAVIPGQAIIDDALSDYPYLHLFPVMEGVTVNQIEAELSSGKEYIRVVATPNSFGKIISAARNLGRLQWLYDNFFLYLDEVHCYATEIFRVDPKRRKPDLLTPFDEHYNYVWQFRDMAMGSATPYRFSDPRILALQHYKINFKEKFGTINIVHDPNPQQVLCQMLTQEDFPGNVHVFFNSVTYTGEIIRQTGITDVNVYCADEERNMKNLDEVSKYFKLQPKTGEYAKFNFYSPRYHDGWNLVDDETATIILVTDVHLQHTVVSIPFKGFQAVGRMKNTPNKIYHITNTHGKQGMRSFEDIQRKHLYNAKKNIAYYNHHVPTTLADGMEDDESLLNLVWPYSYRNNGTYLLSHMRIDQLICKEYCNEHYNNIDSIKQTWEACNYNVIRTYFDFEPLERVKATKEDLNKQVIDRIIEYRKHPEKYNFNAIKRTIHGYKLEFQILFEALDFLTVSEIEKLNYNDKAMKEALINRGNQNAEAKFRIKLIEEFKMKDTIKDKYANRYTQKHVKQTLRRLYDEFGIKNPNGTPKTALANQLAEFGLFEINYDCKVRNEDGKLKPGIEVLKEKFTRSKATTQTSDFQISKNCSVEVLYRENEVAA